MANEKSYTVSITTFREEGKLAPIKLAKISNEKMEELVKNFEGYLLKIDLTESSSYDNSDDDRASCSSSSYDRIFYGELAPKENSKALVFIDGELRGVVFRITPTHGRDIMERVFLFDKSFSSYMSLGYSASHSSRYTSVNSVSLVRRGENGAPEEGRDVRFEQHEMYPSF